jgi:BlaI family transcriptional regulator, penicillinase repressor
MKRAKLPLPRPTQRELEILSVLWTRGPSSVREVQEVLGEGRGYTTILKQLQIMTDKGLVRRDERHRSHVYQAALAQDETRRQLVDDLMERAFDGSASRLVMQALAGRRAKPEDLDAIRKLLDRIERGAS